MGLSVTVPVGLKVGYTEGAGVKPRLVGAKVEGLAVGWLVVGLVVEGLAVVGLPVVGFDDG